MIKKFTRGDDHFDNIRYNLKLFDKNNNSFTMMMGGNLDLYWVPDDYKKTQSFYINREDENVYNIFKQLFSDIEINDSKHSPLLKGNTFRFISEDWPEDEANILEIKHNEDEFEINFIKNENKSTYSAFRRGCVICFCNSGSRVPKIEQLFQMMFNDLAYYDQDIELIK